jgi:serine O-acetyltransferase
MATGFPATRCNAISTKRRYRCDISPIESIGPHLPIAHESDIVTGPMVGIGKDAVIFNGVALGNRLRRDRVWAMPTIREQVLIGTGAKLLGSIDVGDGARIGANAVVLDSVPQGSLAVGNPARIVSLEVAQQGETRLAT